MKITKIAVFIIFILFTLSSTFTFAVSPDTQSVSGEYQIGPENVLRIDIYYGRDKNLSRTVRVSSKGVITFPLLGEIEVNGLAISELQNKLTYLLEKDYLVNPQVSVFIEQYSTVSILGQVKSPGVYPIKGRLSIIELISSAGGFTKIAAINDVRIIRTEQDGSKKTLKIKAGDIINRKGKEGDNMQLKSGDIVTVAESFF